MHRLSALLGATMLALSPLAAEARTVVVTAAHMIDVLSGRRVDDAQVVVTDGRITAVGRRGDAVPTGAERIDLGARTLLPGLLGWLAALPLTGFLVWLAQQALPRFGVGPAPESSGAALSGLGAGEADAGMWVLAYAVAVFLGYLGGGYAAGRAARFGGAKQGVGVFLWFLMITAVSSIVVQALGLPAAGGTMPVAAQDYGGANLGWTGLTVAGTALIALAAATLGGWWGTAYHRRADRWGFQAF